LWEKKKEALFVLEGDEGMQSKLKKKIRKVIRIIKKKHTQKIYFSREVKILEILKNGER